LGFALAEILSDFQNLESTQADGRVEMGPPAFSYRSAIPTRQMIQYYSSNLTRTGRNIMSIAICAKCRQPIPPGSAFCPSCGQQIFVVAGKKRGELGFWIFLAFVVLLIVAVVNMPSRPLGRSSSGATVEPAASSPDPHDLALTNTTITKLSWYKGGFGTVMMANLSIKNDGDAPVKDIEVKCEHSAPSGTKIDQNTKTIYELIPAHKTRTFRNFNMGFIDSQATGTNCRISDLVVAP
jgi:hypothetical protein